jgi:acyl-coenzyme A synthetase/AMP-(fatty) acid ligase
MQPDELLERLTHFGPAPAVVHNGLDISYATLAEMARRTALQLQQQGIGPGDVVALQADFSPAGIAALLAIWQARAVAMPITAAAPARLETCLQITGCNWIFDARHDENSSIIPVDRQNLGPPHELIRQLQERKNPGLILFTSGTTAQPKAVLHDATIFLEKFRHPRPPLRTLAFLIFDHMGGLDTLFYTLSSGGTLITLPQGDRSPEHVARVIELQQVELLPTSPTFLNFLIMSGAHEKQSLASLKRISYGSEPMPESTLKQIQQVLPQVRFTQSYGTSELGVPRVKSLASDSVWLRLGGDGFETRVENGRLFVRSNAAMMGYLNAPSPFDEQGWYSTGDAVETDPTGTFYRILGRASEIITVGGEKVAPAEVESILLQAENVADVQVAGMPNPLLGQMIVARVVLIKPEPLTDLSRRLRGFCTGKLASYQIPMKFEIVSQLPRTTRGKLHRPES